MTRRPRARFLLLAASVVGTCALPTAALSLTTAQFGGNTGSTPTGIALDSAGNVYTSNYGSNSVTRISADGLTTGQFGGTTGAGPRSVAVDSAGNVYTANSISDDVTKIASGGLLTTIRFGGSTVGDTPTGVTVDTADNVFAVSSMDWNVTRISPSGVVTYPFGLAGSFFGNEPVAVAADATGNVYAANKGNGFTPGGANTVTRVSANGATTAQFGGTTGASPRAIALDAAGNVFTANYGDSTVTRISADGATTVQNWGATGDGPTGIAVDPDGNVYTSNEGDDSVWRVSADGRTSAQYGGRTGDAPSGIAIDRDGTVFTANRGDNTVTRISPDRGPLSYAPTAFPTTSPGVASALTVKVTNTSAEGSVRPTSITATGAGVAITGGTCAVGTRVPPRGECTVALSWTPTAVGSLSDATLQILYPGGSGSGEATQLTGTAQASSGPGAPVLRAAVSVSGSRAVSGQPVRIGIRARNTGTAAAQKVVSCLRLPSNVAIVRAPGAVRSGRTVCFRIGTLAAGKSATRTVTVRPVSMRMVTRYVSGSVRATGLSVVARSRTALVITPRTPTPVVTG